MTLSSGTPGTAPARNTGSTDVVEPAGHFRIYLGAAAGVGKTFAMLNEGHRRKRRGTDAIVGFVECHGRPLTENLVEGIEVIPRKSVEYRGARFEEMDVDAVLERHPELALVDELAHTNVSGSGRNERRWQDVMEMLGAGIDVITTLDIQHLESISDAVERISGTPIRERVPDWVVRRADQIELVDSSPEQLRRRMAHGNIYPPDKVPQALTHFFRTDNLIALRELALRFLADQTDEELAPISPAFFPSRHMGDNRTDHGRCHRCARYRRHHAPRSPHGGAVQSRSPRRPRRQHRRGDPIG